MKKSTRKITVNLSDRHFQTRAHVDAFAGELLPRLDAAYPWTSFEVEPVEFGGECIVYSLEHLTADTTHDELIDIADLKRLVERVLRRVDWLAQLPVVEDIARDFYDYLNRHVVGANNLDEALRECSATGFYNREASDHLRECNGGMWLFMFSDMDGRSQGADWSYPDRADAYVVEWSSVYGWQVLEYKPQ